MFHVPGREALYESSWPLDTAWYKAEPKSLAVMQGVRGVHSTVCIAGETQREGRDPASVTEFNAVEEVVIALWLPTQQQRFGNCRGPSIPRPSRQRRPSFMRCMTRCGAGMSCGRRGSKSKPTMGHQASMGNR